jgi:hypothetical protein
MTLTLGLQLKQRHGKVWVENAIRKPHLHSRKCEGMNAHTPKLSQTMQGLAKVRAKSEAKGVTFHALGSVGECEGMNLHTPK